MVGVMLIMGRLGDGSHGWGYAYYGEVRLGHLFILALLG